MGRGIKLSQAQWDELDRARFSSSSKTLFRNCMIILMSDSSDTIDSIAKRVGCGYDTVVRMRRLYRKGGVNALRPTKPHGRPSRATSHYIEAMKKAVETNPTQLGYGFSTWSTVRLAVHLAKITGIRFSDDQLTRLLRRHRYSIQSPKHTLKGKRDEEQFRKAKPRLNRLKKSP